MAEDNYDDDDWYYEDDEDPENDEYETDYDNDYYGYGRNSQEVDGQYDDVDGGRPPRFTSTPKDAGKNSKNLNSVSPQSSAK